MKHATSHARARLVLIGLLALAAVPARAAPVPAAMVVTPNASFLPGGAEYPATLEVAEGGSLLYTNLDHTAIVASSWGWHSVVSHAVDAGGDPLFETPLIGFGQTVTVEGVSQLAPGEYPFYCQAHRDMQATLIVVPPAV